jgi:hypothetical protein
MAKTFYTTVLLIFLNLLHSTVFSQDTLIMKSGNLISSKIIEVSSDKIKYKRFDNPEGPVFIVNSTDVNIIKYKTGITDTIRINPVAAAATVRDLTPPIYKQGPYYKQGYNKFREKEMHALVSQPGDPLILSYVNKANTSKKLEPIGFVAIPAFAFGVVWAGYAFLENFGSHNVSYAPTLAAFGASAAALAASITFKVRRQHYNGLAVRAYNEKY